MATTLPFLSKFTSRGLFGVDARFASAMRYAFQRGAADNVAYNTTAYTGPASTSLAAVTTLQLTNACGFNNDQAVVGGRTYRFRAVLPCTVNGTSGATMDWAGGTATVSAFDAVGYNYTAAAVATLKTTTLAGLTTNAAAAYTSIVVEGTFTASSSGSFGPRLATNTGTATAPIIDAGAFVSLTEIPQSETP